MKSDKKGFRFNKNRFKEEVKSALKNRYRRSIEVATQQQLFQAVVSVIEEMVVEQWLDASQAGEAQQTRIVYYLSMEFLVGRALGNDLLNLGVYEDVKEALDELGLDTMDLKILHALCETFRGRPVGLSTIASAVSEDPSTLEDVYEPYLMQRGLMVRTPQGRMATLNAFNHLGIVPPQGV